jgi:hypothetical protein
MKFFLYPNPMVTFAADHESKRMGALGGTEFFAVFERTLKQMDPDRTLFIADFGAGSDAPILLDYRENPTDPPVIGFKWQDVLELDGGSYWDGAHQWVRLAPSFSEFVRSLGLWDLPKFKR